MFRITTTSVVAETSSRTRPARDAVGVVLEQAISNASTSIFSSHKLINFNELMIIQDMFKIRLNISETHQLTAEAT